MCREGRSLSTWPSSQSVCETIAKTAESRHKANFYRAAAIELANLWASVGSGVVRVISDARFEHKAYEELAEHNLIILGGPKSNSIVEKFDQPFHFLSNNSDSSSPFEMGFRVGNCEYVGKGFGLVSLGPISREPKKNTGLLVTVAGSSIEGALNAFEIFKSNLFATIHGSIESLNLLYQGQVMCEGETVT